MPHVQESSELAGEKYKRPPFCEQLFSIFGHTPRDRASCFPLVDMVRTKPLVVAALGLLRTSPMSLYDPKVLVSAHLHVPVLLFTG